MSAHSLHTRFPTPWLRVVLSAPLWALFVYLYATKQGRRVRRRVFPQKGWHVWENDRFEFFTLKEWSENASEYAMELAFTLWVVLVGLWNGTLYGLVCLYLFLQPK